MSKRGHVAPNPDAGLDAEFHVVGALLHRLNLANPAAQGEVFDRLAAVVGADDFADPRNRAIWEACESLLSAGLPLDRALVCDRVVSAGVLTDVEADEFTDGLSDYVATTVNCEHHGRMVRQYANLRTLVAVCSEGIAKARSSGWQSADEVIEDVIGGLMSRFEHKTAGRLVSLKSIAAQIVADVRRLYDSGEELETVGAPCGIESVDHRLKGFRPGHVYVVGARPAMGKTAVGIAWAAGVAQSSEAGVLYVSAEIPARDIGVRLFGAYSGVNTEVLELGRFGKGVARENTVNALVDASRRIQVIGERLQILDMPGATQAAMRQAVRRMKRQRNAPPLRLVVVDYLQLCRPPEKHPGNREREVAEISAGLLQLAKDESVAVIALCQVNRECEKRADKRPTLADLRESGAIEQDASVVMFLYRDEVYDENSQHKGIVEVIIAKNRLGRTGTARMAFDKTCQRIADLESRYADDYE